MNVQTIRSVTLAGNVQKMVGDALIENAKIIGAIKYVDIPLPMLEVNRDYQRLPKGHERAIANKWDKQKAGTIVVSYRDGNFYIIDGQHRFLAAQMVGEKSMTCQVYENLTLAQEAELFRNQTKDTGRLSTAEAFKAGRAAGNIREDAV